MSFVRSADDVADLLEQLSELDATSKDVTLKIETVGGFEQLPMMLLAAMRWQDSGVSRAWDGAVATLTQMMSWSKVEVPPPGAPGAFAGSPV